MQSLQFKIQRLNTVSVNSSSNLDNDTNSEEWCRTASGIWLNGKSSTNKCKIVKEILLDFLYIFLEDCSANIFHIKHRYMQLDLTGPKRIDSVSWDFLGLHPQIFAAVITLWSNFNFSKILPEVLFECHKNYSQFAYTLSGYHILLIFLFSGSMKQCGGFCRLEKYWSWRITLTARSILKKKPCPWYFPCQVHELQKPIFCLLSRGKGSDNWSILQLITVSEAKSVRKKIQRKKIPHNVYFIEEK